jgi:hypothetical protein
MPNADARIALRDAIRYDRNTRGMSDADIAQKHNISIPSVNAACDNDEIEIYFVPLTQIGTGAKADICIIAAKGVTYQQIAENWKAF